MRHAGEHLRIEGLIALFLDRCFSGCENIVDNDPPDVNFLPVGFMHMATTTEDADKLREAWKMQMYVVFDCLKSE